MLETVAGRRRRMMPSAPRAIIMTVLIGEHCHGADTFGVPGGWRRMEEEEDEGGWRRRREDEGGWRTMV